MSCWLRRLALRSPEYGIADQAPDPIRGRRQGFWGLPGLTPWEEARGKEANQLWLATRMLVEAVATRHGGTFLGHPADPGEEPFPSLWIQPEVTELEERVGAKRSVFAQCRLGAVSEKLTCVSGTLDGIDELDGQFCNHDYHPPSKLWPSLPVA